MKRILLTSLLLLLAVFTLSSDADDYGDIFVGVYIDTPKVDTNIDTDKVSVWYQEISRTGGFVVAKDKSVVAPDGYSFSVVTIWIKNKGKEDIYISKDTFKMSYWWGDSFTKYINPVAGMDKMLKPAAQADMIILDTVIRPGEVEIGWLIFVTKKTVRYKMQFNFGDKVYSDLIVNL